MHAEEYISRYGQMFDDLQAANKEKFDNREKIADYTNLMNQMTNEIARREQVMKDLDESNDSISKLEMKITDNEADIVRLNEAHE